MSQNPKSASEGNNPQQQLTAVKKPWPRWLVVVWMLLISGVVANALGNLIAQKAGGNIQLARFITADLFVFALWLMFGVVTLRKRLMVASAVLLAIVAVLVILNSVFLVMHGATVKSQLTVLIVGSLPCFVAAWYLSRRSFLQLAVNYRQWRNHVNG